MINNLLKLKKAAFVLGMSVILPGSLTACGSQNDSVFAGSSIFDKGYTKTLDVNSLMDSEIKDELIKMGYDKIPLHRCDNYFRGSDYRPINFLVPNGMEKLSDDGITLNFKNADGFVRDYENLYNQNYEVMGSNVVLKYFEVVTSVSEKEYKEYIGRSDNLSDIVYVDKEIRIKVLIYNDKVISFEQTGFGSWEDNIVEANSLKFALDDIDTHDITNSSFDSEEKVLEYINSK